MGTRWERRVTAARSRGRRKASLIAEPDPRAPYRYLDTPEHVDRVDEALYTMALLGGPGTRPDLERLSYYPAERELPDGGGWITILRPPFTVLEERFSLALGQTFWARAWEGGIDGWVDMRYSIAVTTPGGDIRLFPHEYCRAPLLEIVEAWGNGEMTFHPLDINTAAFADRLFYLHSRGIPDEAALPMALGSGEINGPVGWFELAEGPQARLREIETAFMPGVQRAIAARKGRRSPAKPRKRRTT